MVTSTESHVGDEEGSFRKGRESVNSILELGTRISDKYGKNLFDPFKSPTEFL